MHDFLSSIFLGIAIVVVFLVALCVIRCRCARVCPCLCGEEAAAARAELVKDGRKRGKTVLIDEDEDILAEVGGKEGVVEEGAATVAGEEEKEEGEGEEEKKEGGGRVKEEDEESEASLPPSTFLKSLSSLLLALLGMNARSTPTAGLLGGEVEGGGEEELRKKVELEMARLQEEEKEAVREGGVEDLKKKFKSQRQQLQEREGGMEGGLAEESKEYRAVE